MARKKRYAIAVFNTEEMIGECTNDLNQVCAEIVRDGNTPTFYRGVDYYMQVVVTEGTHVAQYDMDVLIRAYGACKIIMDIEIGKNHYGVTGDVHHWYPNVPNSELLDSVYHDGDKGLTYFSIKDIPHIQWEVMY